MGKPSKQAQSIIELAVFGAVIFFLISGIASVYLNGSFQQNAMLQTMRMAMYQSYTTSQTGVASRNSASYILYEDRLTGDFNKYGATDRQPVIMSGSGSLTKNLMLPVDRDETQNLPLMDLKINGQDFHFTTRAFVKYLIVQDSASDVKIYSYSSMSNGPGDLCSRASGLTLLTGDDIDTMRKRLALEWSTYGMGGYPPLYTNIVKNNGAWLSGDQRAFDYNRNGNFTDDFTIGTYSDNFATWQWHWTDLGSVAGEIDAENGAYPSYDMNGDLMEETIYDLKAGSCGGRAAYAAEVMTSAGADWNMEKQKEDYADPHAVQGMRQDMRIYTEMQDGTTGESTYLDIKEGKAYSSDGKPAQVSLVKKAQYDIVERVLQLNRDMIDVSGFLGRNAGSVEVYCGGASPTSPVGARYVGAGDGCCSAGSSVQYTCFDTSTKILYVRSRISDKRGRKWVTSTDQDYTHETGVK